MTKTKDRIREHEGCSRHPYRCTEGFLTIGVGRNLDSVPLSDDEVNLLFDNDYWRAYKGAETLHGFERLNEVRQGVLVEMVFQLGLHGVRKFRKFIDAYMAEDWQAAHDEMLDSLWARQTPTRALRLAQIFLTGEYDR